MQLEAVFHDRQRSRYGPRRSVQGPRCRRCTGYRFARLGCRAGAQSRCGSHADAYPLVLLAGDLAYKLKKPIRLPLSTTAAWKRAAIFCEEEVRLNQRLAPTLYEGVTRITGTTSAPVLDGSGPGLEYAVRIRRFLSSALLGDQLDTGTLRAEQMDRLADLLADFHIRAPRRKPTDELAHCGLRRSSALTALDGVGALTSEAESAALRSWLETESGALAALWATRDAAGHVREWDGDLHLGNVIHPGWQRSCLRLHRIQPKLALDRHAGRSAVPGDGLRGAEPGRLRVCFINAWLDRTGNHASLPALRFSVVYPTAHWCGPGSRACAARRTIRTRGSV